MAVTTFGQIYTFDEFGHGTTPSTIAVDPASGIATVTYLLPFAGTPGDVVLLSTNEPAGTSQISDILRFDGNGHAYFFSDVTTSDPANAPADVGLPPLGPNTIFVTEVGPDDSNSAFYAPPGPGAPGFDPTGPSYSILSDAVPEPDAWTFLTAGIGLWLVLKRRWQCVSFWRASNLR